MGHREELLNGARGCLHEKGWARTSARDIVAASKTNLASIGYHFGSKDALLATALVDLTTEWTAALDQTLTGSGSDAPGSDPGGPMDRFERTWNRVVELIEGNPRLITATVEALAQAVRVREVRAALADAQGATGEDLALMFHTAGEDDERTRVLGSFYQSLLMGVLVRWVIDPATAPTGRDLAAAMRAIVADGELRG